MLYGEALQLLYSSMLLPLAWLLHRLGALSTHPGPSHFLFYEESDYSWLQPHPYKQFFFKKPMNSKLFCMICEWNLRCSGRSECSRCCCECRNVKTGPPLHTQRETPLLQAAAEMSNHVVVLQRSVGRPTWHDFHTRVQHYKGNTQLKDSPPTCFLLQRDLLPWHCTLQHTLNIPPHIFLILFLHMGGLIALFC